MENTKKIKGARAWVVFVPTIIIILILLMAFVVVTVLFNKKSEDDANEAHRITECIKDISSLQSRSSSTVETLSSFVYRPDIFIENPGFYRLNDEPLNQYYTATTQTQNEQNAVFDRLVENYRYLFEDEVQYNGSNTTYLALLDKVVVLMNEMKGTQIHALYLVSKIHHENSASMPKYGMDTNMLAQIGSYEFTDEDLEIISQGNDVIREAAKDIIFEKYYSQSKGIVANLISKISEHLNEMNANTAQKSDDLIWTLRRTLWVLTALIIIMLVVFFAIMYRKLIRPVTQFAKNIQENELLDDESGLYETNYLAKSYNDLFVKKTDVENKLTTAAETDPLTGFDNRYSYNKFLAEKNDSSHSTCIFMLDINNLKYVNDTFGHDKGDELIKNSSIAIRETFMTGSTKNCYRLGGDEFVAIMDNIEEKDINNYLYKFQELQKKYNVSIATGYAYTSDVSIDGYEKLMTEADKRMYENKKEMKARLKEGTA